MDNNHIRLNYIILCRGPYNSVLTDIQKMYQNVKKMHWGFHPKSSIQRSYGGKEDKD